MEFAQTSTAGLTRIIVVCGPTAVGKSAFALRLAEACGGVILNADSVQIYRRLDIGTAKPALAERMRVPHYLVDRFEPDVESNVSDYVDLAGRVIDAHARRGQPTIVVGGTGMYIRLLVHGIFEAPPPDDALRAKYRQMAAEHGSAYVHDRLAEVDPELAERVHPNDMVRIERGLEVFEQTGKPLSVHQREHRFSEPNYHALKIGLLRPRDELYARIDARVDRMMERGLLAEYRGLVDRGFDRGLKPMQALGYRQMGEHVFEGVPLDEAVAEMKRQTRRYAKQQISWFRGEPDVRWAMAPVIGADGQLPAEVVADAHDFLEGGEPELGWAGLDPYDVTRS